MLIAAACTLLAWALASLFVAYAVANSSARLVQGVASFPLPILLAWSLQAACGAAYAFPQLTSLQGRISDMNIAKVPSVACAEFPLYSICFII